MGYPNEDEGPDEVTGPAEKALSVCPFCQGAVQFRKALHICDGNTDAIIHAAPTNCGMVQFEDGSTDESIIAKWNTRSVNAVPVLIEALEEAERFMVYFAEDRTSFVGPGTPMTCLAQIRTALSKVKP